MSNIYKMSLKYYVMMGTASGGTLGLLFTFLVLFMLGEFQVQTDALTGYLIYGMFYGLPLGLISGAVSGLAVGLVTGWWLNTGIRKKWFVLDDSRIYNIDLPLIAVTVGCFTFGVLLLGVGFALNTVNIVIYLAVCAIPIALIALYVVSLLFGNHLWQRSITRHPQAPS